MGKVHGSLARAGKVNIFQGKGEREKLLQYVGVHLRHHLMVLKMLRICSDLLSRVCLCAWNLANFIPGQITDAEGRASRKEEDSCKLAQLRH